MDGGGVGALCEHGRFLEAQRAIASLDPALVRAEPALARQVARALHHLGSPTLSNALGLATFRRAPDHAAAQSLAIWHALEERGPVAAFELTRRLPSVSRGDDEARALLATARAGVHIALRDFDRAGELLGEAAAFPALALPGRLALLERADRLDEALEVAGAAPAEARASYSVAMMVARLLLSRGRREEALAELRRASAATECATVTAMLTEVEIDLGLFAEAAASVAECARRMPLADGDTTESLDARAAEIEYRRGDRPRALALFERVPRLADLASAIRTNPDGKRVVHDVPFVRQDWMTCAPATLTALALFFGRPTDHDEVASRICYDGTPSHAQRRWATGAGFVARELTLTWDAAVALVDAGLPFAVTTVEATSGHIRAVVGYDAARGTLLLREPSVPIVLEGRAHQFLTRYAAHGPRALVIVPTEQASKLEGLGLPDSERYDQLHAVMLALDAHDRARAATIVAELTTATPAAHPVTLAARRALATYDDDPEAMLHVAREMVDAFPADANAHAFLASCLVDKAARDARVDALRRAAEVADHPVFDALLAAELSGDARELPRARRLLRRALAREPSAPTLATLAGLVSQSGDADGGRALLRLAACVDPLHEGVAAAFARELLAAGRPADAAAYLARRDASLGARNAGPTITYLDWLAAVGESARCLDAIDAAVTRRPNDGALACAAAETLARFGERRRAADLVASAEGHVAPSTLLAARAAVAYLAGDDAASLAAYRELLELDPSDAKAHRSVAETTLAKTGPIEAARYLEGVAARHAHNLGLASMWASASSLVSPEEHERVAATCVERFPESAWALREHAIALAERGHHARAAARLGEAIARDPASYSRYTTEGRVHALAGRWIETREALREALRRDADAEGALTNLLAAASELGTEAEELDATRELVTACSLSGAAIPAWFAHAAVILDGPALTDRARELRERRPELWATWWAVASAARTVGDRERAQSTLAEAQRVFPRVAAIAKSLADLARDAGDDDGERSALARALELEPRDARLLRRAAGLAARMGDHQGARALRERAFAAAPLDDDVVAEHARALHAEGDVAGAHARLLAAAPCMPRSAAVWAAFVAVDPVGALGCARELFAARRDVDTAIGLAYVLADVAPLHEAVGVLTSLAMPARGDSDVRDLVAVLLLEQGLPQEALAECQWGNPHYTVRGRGAQLLVTLGRAAEARAILTDLVDGHPSYLFGAQLLYEICFTTGDTAGALAAAQRLVRALPHSPMARRNLARAARVAGDRELARKQWLAAHRLGPDDLAVAQGATDALLALGAERDAREVVERVAIASSTPAAIAAARELRTTFEAAREDEGAAELALAQLACSPGASAGALRASTQHLVAAGLLPAARRALHRAVTRPDANAAVAPLALEIATSLGERPEHVERSFASEPLARSRITAAHLRVVAYRSLGVRLLAAIARRPLALARDPITWGAVGHALAISGWYRLSALWLRRFGSRLHDLDAPTIFDLAVALHARRRFRDAARLSEAALASGTQPPEYRAAHSTLLAFAAATAGDPDRAESLLARGSGEAGGDLAATIAWMTRELVGLARLPQAQRRAAHPAVNARLTAARGPVGMWRAVRWYQWRARVSAARTASARWASLMCRLELVPWVELMIGGTLLVTAAFVAWVALAPPQPASPSARQVTTAAPPPKSSPDILPPAGGSVVLIMALVGWLSRRKKQ